MSGKPRHGHASASGFSHEYGCWAMMKQRCLNPKATGFKYYGAIGVSVCERWMLFDNFITDMGVAPSANHSLDRWPNKFGNYEPGNVRWATRSEQARNTRPMKPRSESHRANHAASLRRRAALKREEASCR